MLLTTAAEHGYLDHAYRDDQVLLFGRESAGVPEAVHEAADARLRIPIAEGLRSLNVAMAVAHGRRRGAAADGRLRLVIISPV